MSKFQPGKTYQTRNDESAFVGYERDGFLFGNIGQTSARWTMTGCRWSEDVPSLYDLLPPEPTRIRERGWCNVYGSRMVVHVSEQNARSKAAADALHIAVPCELIEIEEDK